MERIALTVAIKQLHEPEMNPYRTWSPAECLDELERLRQKYIRWKYPDVEPRLQRVAAIVQREKR